ncbi:MAG TPA: NAD-dependent succinate-semialdehyde dehydrogenase [Haliangiales bacterium]|nr:NAD-dependent succinate-semialdehyde dehydrogenase [Haliangiales bacterium]
MIATVNPATGETVRTFAEHTDGEIETRLARAAAAFRTWRRSAPADRSRLLARAAELLEADKARLGALMVLEMGKTRRAAVAEVEKCALACRYYAEHAAAHLADEKVAHGIVKYLPLGPVLAVMPWNFPFWQVFRFAAPALAAGNVGLLKHASNVPQCALAIEDVLARAGFPPGAFQTLLVSARRTECIIADPRVAALTLTGSEGAGAKVGEAAGRNLKKTVLELGGSDPFIVLPSADLAAAARTAVVARMINNGQSCIAAKRFIVHAAVYEPFRAAFLAALAKLKVGDPMADDTDVGPIATADGLETLAAQVDGSAAAGARVLHGGRRLPGPGFWYAPTLLADIPRAAPAFAEEVFGPVALLHRAKDLDEAIALANDNPYGLGSSVWTNDPAERTRLVEEIEAGCTFVNAMVVSDPRLPFGGVKRSGYGRELGSFGIREFVNIKTVVSA